MEGNEVYFLSRMFGRILSEFGKRIMLYKRVLLIQSKIDQSENFEHNIL